MAGGPAANAAVTFRALGGNSCLVSSVGTGPLAATVLEDLESYGVLVIDATTDAGIGGPPVSTVIVYTETGERSVVSLNGMGRRLEGAYDPAPFEPGVVLIDGHYSEFANQSLSSLKSEVPVVMDAGSWKDHAESLLESAHAIICSEDFNPPNVGTEGIEAYLINRGATFVATTRGANPVTWQTVDAAGIARPPRVDAVDTSGAGDILHGAFAHAVASLGKKANAITTDDWVSCLTASLAIASFSCRSFGTRSWIAELHGRQE